MENKNEEFVSTEETRTKTKATVKNEEVPYTIETRVINGQEVQVKVYKEVLKRPVTQVCR